MVYRYLMQHKLRRLFAVYLLVGAFVVFILNYSVLQPRVINFNSDTAKHPVFLHPGIPHETFVRATRAASDVQFQTVATEIIQQSKNSTIKLCGKPYQLRSKVERTWMHGNEMFQYASLQGINEKQGNNWCVCLESFSKLKKTFELSGVPDCRPDPHRIVFEEKKYGYYDERTEALDKKRDIFIDGYLQSWKYFDDIRDKVKRMYSFRQQIREQAKRKMVSVMKNKLNCDIDSCELNFTTVGIHVRRGDIIEMPSLVKYGYKDAPMSYFIASMDLFRSGNITKYNKIYSGDLNSRNRHVQQKFHDEKKILFYVVTENVTWCEQNFNGSDVTCGATGNSPAVDMATLTLCNHVVISVGTFGWWGAWLAGGTTIYYKDWPRPGSILANNTNHRHYFPPNWIGLTEIKGRFVPVS